MEKATINLVTRSHATQLLLIISTLFASTWSFNALEVTAQALLVGFKATPSHSVSSFHPLLSDSTGNFSLGFLRVNQTQLSLTVIHNPTLQPLWQASPTTTLFSWSEKTLLFFNGSLVLSDQHAGLFWSTATTNGDKVVLLNSSNLQILNTADPPGVVWQSFDFPTDTLVENQDFRSDMTLVSSNGVYSMRLGDDYMALYAKFQGNEEQIYWKHKALEAKAAVVEGNGPISARVNAAGYIGMYQNGSTTPVDVQPFNSFQRPINRFLLVRLEQDGNLKGYYWDGTNWDLDYQAISDMCQLPSPCGPYGLCRGSGCSCLDNTTQLLGWGQCYAGQPGDLCSGGGDDKPKIGNNFWVLRRKGVDLPYKELMDYKMATSLENCEGYCEGNCSCWGAVYNNASGFCYLVDYPIQTLLSVGDEGKMGYFKVGKSAEKKKNVGLAVGVGVGVGSVVILGLLGSVGLVGCKIWRTRGERRRGVKRVLEEDEGVSPGPYKNLGSPSFSSIEMSPR
ncbi:hypothetical protein Tsubulata_045321 [Turnera subulata]|uniref:Apple domain-containing protein n=1 Tax=Turnera subulata TaxID=218843 RepID=A0A9Q0FWV6_9ROSI|nr:hypothetical protein Tsubulata_045321 [Turnera subulata]